MDSEKSELKSIEKLLNEVKSISDTYDIVAKNTGENFNIFSVLEIESKELYHSKMIGALLNCNGSHKQGSIFLELFVNEMRKKFDKGIVPDFSFEKPKLTLEKKFRSATNNEGGQIDIYIEDTKGRGIIFENKINAREQDNQLARYETHCKECFKGYALFYLTLDGKESKTANQVVDYYPISYKEDIINWLILCKKEAVILPKLRETIAQYIDVIKKLTNQTINDKMSEEIIKKIIENNDNLKSAESIKNNYDEAKKRLLKKQIQNLKEQITKVFEREGEKIDLERSEEKSLRDDDGLFIPLTMVEVDNEEHDFAINIELTNNYYFFCLSKNKGGDRDEVNNEVYKKNSNVSNILELLKKECSISLNVSNNKQYMLAKQIEIDININKDNFYYPLENNTEKYEKLAKEILKYYKVVNGKENSV